MPFFLACLDCVCLLVRNEMTSVASNMHTVWCHITLKFRLLGCFGTIPYTNQPKNNTIRPKIWLFSLFIHSYIHFSSCTITQSQNAQRICEICTPTFTSCSLKFACFLLISFSSTLEYSSFKETKKNWTKNIIIIS